MSGLDEKGLEAALNAFNGGMVREPSDKNPRGFIDFYRPMTAMETAIRTYLAASAPPAPDGLVALLRHLISLDAPEKGGPYQGLAARECLKAMSESAATLSAQEAEIERLRKELAEEQETWPKWAAEICKCLRGYGVDPGDEEGWDLPAQFEDWVRGVVENETARAESSEAEAARLESDISRANHALETALSEHAEMRDALTVEVARLRKVVERAKEVNKGHIDAWESLPGGRNYGLRDVEKWVQGPMYKAVTAARQFAEEVK
jgi:hypothetical protein